MRDAGAAQAELALALERDEYFRVRISDHEGTLVDRTHWVREGRIYDDVEAFAAGCDLTLHRRIGEDSIAPLMTDPPMIAGGRRVLVECAFTALGGTPAEGDWIPLFDGRVDDPQWGGLTNDLTFSCRSRLAALLHDRWLESAHIGEYSGLQQNVMQELMDNVLGGEAPTLVVIGDPATTIPPYNQRRQSLADALRALADVNGWVVRERWHDPSDAFRLVLYEPDRDQVDPDLTWGLDDFVQHSDVRLQTLGVRTVVEIEWQDDLFGIAEDSDAIAMEGVGRKVLYIDASDDPLITSQAQAQELAELILRDVSTALVGQSSTHGLFWRVQLGDLYEYPPDGEWADESRKMAVIGYEHVFTGDPETPSETRIDLRGQPSGGADRWYVKDRRTRQRQDLLPPDEDPLPPVLPPGEVDLYYTQPAATQGFQDPSERDESLGKYISTTRIDLTAPLNVFGELSQQQVDEGHTEYIIIALANEHGWMDWPSVRGWVDEPGGGGVSYAMALDPAGLVALEDTDPQGEEIADKTTAPTGYTFESPETPEEGLVIGDVGPRECIFVGLRREVTAGATGRIDQWRFCFQTCYPREPAPV